MATVFDNPLTTVFSHFCTPKNNERLQTGNLFVLNRTANSAVLPNNFGEFGQQSRRICYANTP